MASEHLLVYALVRHFACTIVEPTGRLQSVTNVFRAICEVVDAILLCKRGSRNVDKVRQAVADYHRLAQEAHGIDNWRWKHHAMLHIASQIEKDGVVLDTFVLERKHQIAKHAASNTKILKSFERSALSGVVLEQRRQLNSLLAPSGLVGKTFADNVLLSSWSIGEVFVAEGIVYNGGTYSVGDVVLVNKVAATVLICFEGRSQSGLVVSPFRLHRLVHQAAAEWVPTDTRAVHFFADSDILAVHCWSVAADGTMLVLHYS